MTTNTSPPSASPNDPANDEMTIWEHVTDLRKRLLVSLVALVVTVSISFYFSDDLIHILARPIGGIEKLISIEVTENVGVFMKVSLLSGFILALPLIVYEILGFIFKGLYEKERRRLLMIIPFATLLFLAGVAFAFFIMLPNALPFLLGFIGVETTPRLSNYFSFITSLLFWMGLSFETPLVVFILARLNVIQPKDLAKQWRIAVVVIAIIAAVVTPTPDPINMGLMMLPLLVLYGLSILLAWFATRKQYGQKEL